MNWYHLLFSLFLFVIWIASGVFITSANIKLTETKDKDTFLNRAYWMSFSAAFITWFIIAAAFLIVLLAIFGIIGLFGSGVGEAGFLAEGAASEGGIADLYSMGGYFNEDQVSTITSWIPIILFIVMMILVIITGVLSAIASTNIKESNNSNTPTLEDAYNDCVIAGTLSLGVFVLFVIGFIIYYISEEAKKRQLEQLKIQEEQQREYLIQQIEAEKIKRNALLTQSIQNPYSISQLYNPSQNSSLYFQQGGSVLPQQGGGALQQQGGGALQQQGGGVPLPQQGRRGVPLPQQGRRGVPLPQQGRGGVPLPQQGRGGALQQQGRGGALPQQGRPLQGASLPQKPLPQVPILQQQEALKKPVTTQKMSIISQEELKRREQVQKQQQNIKKQLLERQELIKKGPGLYTTQRYGSPELSPGALVPPKKPLISPNTKQQFLSGVQYYIDKNKN